MAYRDDIQKRLADKGIGTLIHYPIPPHRQNAYDKFHAKAGMLRAERLASRVLSLPMGPHLSDSEVLYVADSLKLILKL